jgi:hypothetical protein
MGWKICGSNPGRGKRYFSLQNVQTDSRAHPDFYSMCRKVLFPGVKRLGSEADHSLACRAEVKNKWGYTSTPLIRLHSVERENFSLLPLLMCHWFPVCIPKKMM